MPYPPGVGHSLSPTRRLLAGIVVGILVASCGSESDTPTGSTRVDRVRVEVLVSGLDGPTQLSIGDDGRWYVAQLAGDENEGSGQVLRLDPDDLDAEPAVLLDGLDKPTGVAVFAGELWVMERRRLSRGPLDGSERIVVFDEMAHNGRSQGALTVDGDRLLFNTSGSSRTPTGPGGDPVTTSGALWAVDAAGSVTPLGHGFKHAYVQAIESDGTIWTTELADGRHDGQPAVDEVVAVARGADHGWPDCVGDNRPVAERGATEATCADVPASHAVFEPGATPTGLAVAPWDPEQLIVALWVQRRIVAIPTDPAGAPVGVTLLTDDVGRPQHLTPDGARLLVTDHERGQIIALQPR